ncbi:TnsA-like heteromeric transposase endonuclease subunit [Leifsonia sp. NPDC056665]|uniref:TnsA-like heteromeric transposase endonuclease subunit n=1 Tax=Leifsonia sp. NPDC056665 TaxID=3345901 RepID=UPI0036C9BC55
MLQLPSAAPNDFSRVTNPGPGDFVWWTDSDGEAHCERANQRVAYDAFGRARRARASHNYPKRRHYEGEYWFAGTRKLVWFESLLEYTALMRLDYLFPITQISAQPMCIVYADGHRSFPDYFALHADGRRVLYEVKSRHHLTEEVAAQFRQTAEVCYRIGWEFSVIQEFPVLSRKNLEWVGAYRHPWYAPSRERRNEFLRSLRTPCTFGQAMQELDPASPPRSIHTLYHLIWTRDLVFDGSRRLNLGSVLTSGDNPNSSDATPNALPTIAQTTLLRPNQLAA